MVFEFTNTRVKYKSKYDIAKEISIKTKMAISDIIDIFSDSIENKYEEDFKTLISEFLYYIQTKSSNLENGAIFVKDDKKSILLLSTNILKSNFKNKIKKNGRLVDKLNILSKIYDRLIVLKSITFKYDDQVLHINIKKLKEIKYRIIDVPKWEIDYVYPSLKGGDTFSFDLRYDKSYLDNYVKVKLDDQCLYFFNILKNNFLKNVYFDLGGNLSYAFLLMYYIGLSDIDADKKSEYLFNLGVCYPKTFLYHLKSSSNYIIKKYSK